MGSTDTSTYDVLIVGAGLSGICSLYHIRERFPLWRIKLIEAGSETGGVWHWNRYPGARCDTESLSYCYSFDKEVLQGWEWKEAFASQADTLSYIRHVCEKHNLYKDIQFNTRINSAYWQDADRTWLLIDQARHVYKTTFFISCMGFLSAPAAPKITGIEKFRGNAFHTSRWPQDIDLGRDFAGKRVGVIGTGATGIQTITALSKESINSLHVFQRTANWAAPLRNTTYTAAETAQHHTDCEAILKRCAETPTGFLHRADPRKSSEVTDEERLAHFEKIYAQPGFSKWLGVFSDTFTDRQANKLYSDFIADKIRQRVKNPSIAESLIPKNHGFGTRRIPLESGYFEVFNKPNVQLVDLQQTPITCATSSGLMTSDGTEHELDILIYATGFDAITGAFNEIEWHAKDGRPLIASSGTAKAERAIWPDHQARTFLGITAPAMPNMLMVLGPHQPFGNAARSIEHSVSVICELLQHCKDKGYSYVEPTPSAVEEWTEHVVNCSKGSLINEVDSWMTGVNKNVSGKTVRSVARYAGSVQEYQRRCRDCKVAGWKGLVFA